MGSHSLNIGWFLGLIFRLPTNASRQIRPFALMLSQDISQFPRFDHFFICGTTYESSVDSAASDILLRVSYSLDKPVFAGVLLYYWIILK